MTFPFGETVFIGRGSGRDGDGGLKPVTSWTRSDGWAFAPAGSVETIQGQDIVIDQPSLYRKGDVDVEATDVIVRGAGTADTPSGGVIYEVDGEPQHWPANPYTGREAGVVLRLRKVSG